MSSQPIANQTMPVFPIRRTFAPIDRETLARYASASGDLNPVHLDPQVARAAGFDDVFAQGMLVMAYMGLAVTDLVGLERLRTFSTRFLAATRIGDVLTCTGREGEIFSDGGEDRMAIHLEMTDQQGEVKLAGLATVAL